MFREPPELFTVHYRSYFLIYLHLVGFARIGRVHYEYLPPSIELLIVSSCKQKYKLETRLLPRRLRELDMSFNKLFGSIDMQRLPPKLETLDVSQNLITGLISLQRLPPTLKSASLWSNKIEQRVVPCDPLPPGVTRIGLGNNKVREVRFVSEWGDFGGSCPIEEIMPNIDWITTEDDWPVWTQSAKLHEHRELSLQKAKSRDC